MTICMFVLVLLLFYDGNHLIELVNQFINERMFRNKNVSSVKWINNNCDVNTVTIFSRYRLHLHQFIINSIHNIV